MTGSVLQFPKKRRPGFTVDFSVTTYPTYEGVWNLSRQDVTARLADQDHDYAEVGHLVSYRSVRSGAKLKDVSSFTPEFEAIDEAASTIHGRLVEVFADGDPWPDDPSYQWHDGMILVQEFIVTPELRRLGIGRHLIKALYAANYGFNFLCVLHPNPFGEPEPSADVEYRRKLLTDYTGDAALGLRWLDSGKTICGARWGNHPQSPLEMDSLKIPAHLARAFLKPSNRRP